MEQGGVIENELKHIREELEDINRHLELLNSKTASNTERLAVHHVSIEQNADEIEALKPVVTEIRAALAARAEAMKVFDRTVTDVNALVAWMNQQKGGYRASHLIGSVVVGLIMSVGAFVGMLVAVKQYLHP
jgi:chromosome segregation ATPase